VRRGYKEDNWGDPVRRGGTGGYEERNLASEVEKSPLLEAVARERLVKTQQAEKSSADAVVICELWRLAAGL
jgi:hypothetical protein